MKDFYRYIDKKELNKEELKYNRLSYAHLFYNNDSLILANNIINCNDLELENGEDYDEENDTFAEIYQYYIIDGQLAERLEKYTHELIYYSPNLDIYVLGVCHWGTSWNYVLTDLKLEKINGNEYIAISDKESGVI